MKEIPLSKGMVAIVDDDDFERVSDNMWHSHYNGSNYYASRNALIKGKWRQLLLHRFIIGAKDGQTVDHINHNTLDCRKSNLRICTASQNLANSTKSSGKTSIYKGVSRRVYNGNLFWQCKIQVSGECIFLGIFDDELSAAYTYNTEASRIFGEFAVLNIIPDDFVPSPKRERDFSKMKRGEHDMYTKG